MYGDNAQQLLAFIRTVPTFAANTGMALGGRGDDPGLTKLSPPYAWPVFVGDENRDPPKEGIVANPPTLLVKFAVVVGLPYNGELDLIQVQLPLLKALVQAINGQQTPTGSRWRYSGARPPVINPDRVVYTQLYTTIASQ